MPVNQFSFGLVGLKPLPSNSHAFTESKYKKSMTSLVLADYGANSPSHIQN
jgi:hypothetical protein